MTVGESRLRRLAVAGLIVLRHVLGLGSLGLVIAWAIGCLLSDRWHWSQYLAWIPASAAATGGMILVALRALPGTGPVRSRSLRRPQERMRRWSRRAGLTAGVVLPGVYTLAVDARLHARLARAEPVPPEAVRLVFWNLGGARCDEAFLPAIRRLGGDVVVLVDPGLHVSRAQVAEQLGEPVELVSGDRLEVLSRFSVTRYGFTWVPVGTPATPALARAMYVALAVPSMPDGALTLWIVDLPSDLRLARRHVTRRLAEGIARWRGEERVRDARGWWSSSPGGAFPAPDVVVGDFNIPRGSVSLRALVGEMLNAHDVAGATWGASWPEALPLLHLDQTFLGPRVRALSYRLERGGFGWHLPQVCILTATPTP